MSYTFQIEVTDTYAGEANYCWVKRYEIKANSIAGAIQKFAKERGGGWRKDWDTGDTARYNLRGRCICCFVTTDWE